MTPGFQNVLSRMHELIHNVGIRSPTSSRTRRVDYSTVLHSPFLYGPLLFSPLTSTRDTRYFFVRWGALLICEEDRFLAGGPRSRQVRRRCLTRGTLVTSASTSTAVSLWVFFFLFSFFGVEDTWLIGNPLLYFPYWVGGVGAPQQEITLCQLVPPPPPRPTLIP
jgi:hypothetical protein